MRWVGVIDHYREYLPVSAKTPVITLYEGNTPLIPAEFLNKITGLQVFLKYEGLNPTGSFLTHTDVNIRDQALTARPQPLVPRTQSPTHAVV